MRTAIIFIKILCLNILMINTAWAADITAESGVHYGGDAIATVNGTDGSPETLRAGEGMSIAGGFGFPLENNKQFIITFGMKQEVVYFSTGSIRFVRYPLDILMIKQRDKWAYGGGLTAHMNPQVKVETETVNQSTDFDNALGAVFDLRYFIFPEVFISGRITWIKYKVSDDPDNASYNGSSIGVLAGIRL